MNVARLLEAADVVNFDGEEIDLPLLVGALATIQRWAASAPELKAHGKASMCDKFRTEGQRLIDEAEEAIEPEPEMVLRIYRAASGQWSGKLLADGEEFGGVAGFDSPEAVEQAAYDSGIYPGRIDIEADESPNP